MCCRGLQMHYFIGTNLENERKCNIQLCSLFLLYNLQGLILWVNFSNGLSYLLDNFLHNSSLYCLLKSVSFFILDSRIVHIMTNAHFSSQKTLLKPNLHCILLSINSYARADIKNKPVGIGKLSCQVPASQA